MSANPLAHRVLISLKESVDSPNCPNVTISEDEDVVRIGEVRDQGATAGDSESLVGVSFCQLVEVLAEQLCRNDK